MIRKTDFGCHQRRDKIASRKDVRLLGPVSSEGGDCRPDARGECAGHAESGTPQRRIGKRGVAQEVDRRRSDVIDSNPAYDVTHEKSMVVDDQTAFVKSLNWQTKNLTETRDYAVVTSHAHEVSEIIECFEADWKRKNFKGDENSHLIWC